MRAHVGFRVGALRRTQQADAQLVAVAAVAVLRVGEQRRAEAVLGEVGPALAGHLVARAVEARRVVRRPLGVAERRLVRRVRRVHVQREADLEQLVLLVPVDGGVELESPRAGVETHDLAQRAALADAALECDLGAQRPYRHHRARLGRRAVHARLEVERVDVPGVELDRQVLVQLEQVAGRREHLAPGLLLDHAQHAAVLAQLDAQVLVLERQAVDAHLRRPPRPRGRPRTAPPRPAPARRRAGRPRASARRSCSRACRRVPRASRRLRSSSSKSRRASS